MQPKGLSNEVVSLVHHIELNKSGWWDKGIQRLILAALWLSAENLTVDQVSEHLSNDFHLRVDAFRLRKQVETLRGAGTLILLPDGRLKVSEAALKEVEEEVKDAEHIEDKAKTKFVSLLEKHCPGLNTAETWLFFRDRFLSPLVREIGARTYNLISGSGEDLDTTDVMRSFLNSFSPEFRDRLRVVLFSFLDPKDAVTRSYILRHLNAYFFVEAGSLKQSDIENLSRLAEHPPSFLIFVDTNFLFSILELHENPSNEAVNLLMQITAALRKRVNFRLYAFPLTLDETKLAIRFHKDMLAGLDLKPNLAEAALQDDLSGVALKFIQTSIRAERRILPDDYFGPYLTDLTPILRSKSVEFFNENVDSYKTRQDVVDDILSQIDFEKHKYGPKAKSYEKLEHDVVLWHFVKDKRPIRVESPLEARYWVVTVDYHYLAFDAYKQEQSQSKMPICLHPTTLIQMLQFWLPRTSEFEEALLGSLRWPFLFHDFDPVAETATIRILETLSRFETAGDLPTEVVTSILVNQALRQKLAAEGDVAKRIELVREAIIEEHKNVQGRLGMALSEANLLKGQINDKEGKIRDLQRDAERQRSAIESTEQDLASEIATREALQDRLEQVEQQLRDDKKEEGIREIRRSFVLKTGGLLVALIVASVAGFLETRSHWGFWRSGIAMGSFALISWVLLIEIMAARNETLRKWGPVVSLRQLRTWVISVLVALTIGIFSSAIWDWIKMVYGFTLGSSAGRS